MQIANLYSTMNKRNYNNFRKYSNYKLVDIVISNLGNSENSFIFEKLYFPTIKKVFEFISDNPNRMIDFFEIFGNNFRNVIKIHEKKILINYLLNNFNIYLILTNNFIANIFTTYDLDYISLKLNRIRPEYNFILTGFSSYLFGLEMLYRDNQIGQQTYHNKTLKIISLFNDPKLIIDYLFDAMKSTSDFSLSNHIYIIFEYLKTLPNFHDYIDEFNDHYSNLSDLEINPKLSKSFIEFIIKFFGHKAKVHKLLIHDILYTLDYSFIKSSLKFFKPNYDTVKEAFYSFCYTLSYAHENSYNFAESGNFNIRLFNMVLEACEVNLDDLNDDQQEYITEMLNTFEEDEIDHDNEIYEILNGEVNIDPFFND